jgi:hypothetical protein
VNWARSALLALTLSFSAGPVWVQADGGLCHRLTGTQTAQREYPRGINPAILPNGHFMFGYEIEYAIQEMAPGLLLKYLPPKTMIKKAQWISMTHAERVQWFTENKEVLFPRTRSPGLLKLEKSHPFWPEALILDETGNLELIVKEPFDSHKEFETAFDSTIAAFGEGYLQATTSYPGEVVYKTNMTQDGYVGMRIFFGEYDSISKLSEAYEKHQKTPAYIPAKNFTHPFLGPMTSIKKGLFISVLGENARGNFDQDMMKRISQMDSSYKYTSNTVYRPDIIRTAERILNESRDCVKSPGCLKAKVRREKYLASKNFDVFYDVRWVDLFDPVAHYETLSDQTQTFLEACFPRKVRAEEIGTLDSADVLSLELYRNFAYPMQHWRSWFEILKTPTDSAEYRNVIAKRQEYRNRIDHLAREFAAGALTAEAGAKQVRIAIAQFVAESGMKKVMEKWLETNLPDYKTESIKWEQ